MRFPLQKKPLWRFHQPLRLFCNTIYENKAHFALVFLLYALLSGVNCCWSMRQRHPARAVVRLCGQVRDSRLQFAVLYRHSYLFQTASVYLKMDNPVKGLTTVSWQQVSVLFFFHLLSSSYRLLCCNFVSFQAFLNNCFPCLTCIQEELNDYRSQFASFHTEIYKSYQHEACEKSESLPMQRKEATPQVHFTQEVQEKPNRKRKRW